ncbi:MAG: hypothetical protein SOR93_09360 [Clostridiales Family XIII bacterium]|nr:hypothetical protein [Clostridia bacterium]MDY3011441.1 hypothetical protein [Clostridiales Family XIII bacterium]MDY4602100.1 hypothetical protein [Bacteroides uniformis]
MIKIIKGTFGLYKDGVVVGITKDNGPISIDPEREKELIELGIAEMVNGDVMEEGFEVSQEYLDGLNLTQLKEFASNFDIKYKAGTKKTVFVQEILDFLDKEAEAHEKIAESDEETPGFDPEDAVQ